MTTTAEETARIIADCFATGKSPYPDLPPDVNHPFGSLMQWIERALLAHGAAERARCAAIADQRANICLGAAEALDDPSERCAGIEARHIADLIRALASAGPNKEMP